MEKKFGNTTLAIFAQESDVYLDMAMAMLHQVMEDQKKGKKTVMIVPVGPTGQYPIFARLVNELRISLKDVYLFNMDEYLLTPTQPIAPDHPMSFHHRMQTELYDQLDPALTVPKDHRFFPEPGKEKEYDELIESLGGVDLCLGGLGINGHIAFNEPPELDAPPVTAEEFAALPTRVLPITRETRTVNAIGYQRGDLSGMPEFCITVGMKAILSAKKVYIALNREWQHGIAHRALTGEVTAYVPASLLQNHPCVRFAATASIAQGL